MKKIENLCILELTHYRFYGVFEGKEEGIAIKTVLTQGRGRFEFSSYEKKNAKFSRWWCVLAD